MMAAALLLPSCRPAADPYDRWADGHRQAVADYAAHLTHAGVADVFPMRELLRRGRRWRICGGTQFAVPARKQWDAIVPTLVLVRELRARNLLPDAYAVSAWRDPEFNDCEGGSRASRHLENNAVDIEFTADAATTTRLCTFWRRQGASRAFGLGFYAPAKIHVDTSGFRTWGSDFHRPTSLCLRRPD